MENNLMIIMNLLFIPIFSIFILSRISEKKFTNFEIIAHYMMNVVIVSIISQILSKIVTWLFDKIIMLESLKYSIIALVVSLALPFIVNSVKLKYDKVMTKKVAKEEEKTRNYSHHPHYVRLSFYFELRSITSASQTQGYALQTVLGINLKFCKPIEANNHC
jgi:hypothetical protein